jgi:hypothetical protein
MASRSRTPRLTDRSGADVGPLGDEGPAFVPPDDYAPPPAALHAILDLLVRTANHHRETAAG